jgi:integrase
MPSVYERQPGVYTLRVSNGFDPIDGRRLIVTETFRGSKTAARQRASDLQREVKRTPGGKGATTLKACLKEWRAHASHAAGTVRNYNLAERTIPAHLLKTPVGKIRTETLRELNKRIETDHGIERTRLVHAVISGALSYAWRMEWIPENVALKVVPPAPKRRKHTTPTAVELGRLLTLLAERPELYAWVLLSAMVGGRPSEILALQWSDVDLQRGEVTISKALNPVGGGVKLTKTEDERTVAIGPKVVAALEVWRDTFTANALTKPVKDPYLFVRPGTFDGSQPWRPDYGAKTFAKLRKKAGINPKVRRYDLRHYVATMLIDSGVPLKTVGERMGHTRLATTANVYGHLVHASDHASAALLEAGIG